jgi:hypothetical protein
VVPRDRILLALSLGATNRDPLSATAPGRRAVAWLGCCQRLQTRKARASIFPWSFRAFPPRSRDCPPPPFAALWRCRAGIGLIANPFVPLPYACRPRPHSRTAPGRLGLVPLQPIGAIETPPRESPLGKSASPYARSALGAQICSGEPFHRGERPNSGRLQHPKREV